MKIEIHSCFNKQVLFEYTHTDNTLVLTVEAAVKNKSNLSGANLYGAKLSGANLYGANLSGATYGDATFTKGFLQLNGFFWPILFFDDHIKIGCELHTTTEWSKFNNKEIARMDTNNAEDFCKNHKSLILQIAAHHQKGEKS